MRSGLALAAWCFADPTFQAGVWAHPELPTEDGALYFELAISEIFDTGFLDRPSSQLIGSSLVNEDELAKLRAFAAVLESVLAQIYRPGVPVAYADAARSPGWTEVRSAARTLLEALIAGGGIRVQDPPTTAAVAPSD